ncbi:DEAD/DEAH box helicase [Rhabdothermincola sediminis]|uniref:DEAD/DEAH box helicase n=1 Tax=Rhabdothermincola sediminis TaxID=2751370 RepID=UPI001AA09D29|nr:DEAD/DEAH box helicase [Rhabdothermincola sediminis]
MPERGYDFDLDRFQIEAMTALERGESVLVAAPTGSGKTVVAEHAVELALRSGRKAFYTTPIKALSNQKFHDLVRRHGAGQVGLLTGDNTINGDAPIVVMTTEVLRNMIYARSGALVGLRFVVLDEVHYLQDAYRGPVWEEVIVHLPPEVRLVCLSATVSNAEELTSWITTVRGPTATVIEERRPVALENLFAVEDRLRDELVVIPTLTGGKPNRQGSRYDVDPRQAWRSRNRRRYATPTRSELVAFLDEHDLLPAIYFIFSRAACDDAVTACLRSGHRLTDGDERARIRHLAERHVASLSDADLEVLDHRRWLAGLEAGFAAHHAGMVPPFKEAVEACFVEGLVKVVFATETLSLGINMPARSVVIEKLTKFTGERHEFLTPAQYTQLTGRAGRRGIDDHGTAIALWSPFVPFADVAALAASRSFRLSSAFRPTYNMAANLVRRYPADRAHRLLNLSFAQFQADRAVVRLETRLAARKAHLDELRAAATCELGDVGEYRALVDAERSAGRARGSVGEAEVREALSRLKPGDVIWLHGGKSAGKAAVLSVSHRKAGAVRLRVITPQRRVLNLGAADFRHPPARIGEVPLPQPFAPQSASFQRAVIQALQQVAVSRPPAPTETGAAGGVIATTTSAEHPVGHCPERDRHLRAARQLARAEREVDDLERQIRSHTESLARQFDRVCQLLEAWGYLEGWSLTRRGERLVRIFHESDLLVAESLEAGLLDGLDPASLAGVVSCFTYEHRAGGPPLEPWFPSATVRHRVEQIGQITAELNADERRLGLSQTRGPDPGFLALAHAWAAGEGLDDVLAEEGIAAGDFVRNVKQLLDLLRQIGEAASEPQTAVAARLASDALFRGVVAASSAIESPETADQVPTEPVG